jgi:hypothetical protein
MAKSKSENPAGPGRTSRRIKCACAACTCTVDMDRGYRKGAQVYCCRACAEACTKESCRCEHDGCG